jgi:hypothetical protein
MATGWLMVAAIDILDDRGAEYRWVKAHVGDPGAAGTANPAVETTRKQATWGAAVAAVDNLSALMVWTGDLDWTAVLASEDWTHVSGWSLATGGVPGWTGQLAAPPQVVGNNFKIPAGAYILRQPVAS